MPKGHDDTKPINLSNFLKEIPKNGCTPTTNLLIAMRTSPTEFKGREWARNTWGKFRSPNVPLIFLIGTIQVCTLSDEIFLKIILTKIDDKKNHYADKKNHD